MKQPLSFLLLTVLLIGLLPTPADARGKSCFGPRGLGCSCCAHKMAQQPRETVSPCPCTGPDLSLSVADADDLLTGRSTLEIDLPMSVHYDSSTLVPRDIFGTTPQKPPPSLF
jgi:hypothetical protein